ncbi:hypothetical protein PV325_011841 [Microctonus aethiopoides]|nr:hypothetical protein PV325_011841 [Microctonus aethiopoides]
MESVKNIRSNNTLKTCDLPEIFVIDYTDDDHNNNDNNNSNNESNSRVRKKIRFNKQIAPVNSFGSQTPFVSPRNDQSWRRKTTARGVDPRLLLSSVSGGDRNAWEGRYRVKEHRRAGKATFQGQVYNFLERPTGWKCFLYHFSV